MKWNANIKQRSVFKILSICDCACLLRSFEIWTGVFWLPLRIELASLMHLDSFTIKTFGSETSWDNRQPVSNGYYYRNSLIKIFSSYKAYIFLCGFKIYYLSRRNLYIFTYYWKQCYHFLCLDSDSCLHHLWTYC